MLASTFWAASSGIAGAAPAAYAADVAPRGMIANATGMYHSLADSGYVLGPLVLGGISDVASPEAALGFTSILLILAGSMFAVRARETLRPHIEPAGSGP
jgi:MFS transporter, DHA1 family, multidrug resistance protein